MSSDSYNFLIVDIGGTKIRFFIVNENDILNFSTFTIYSSEITGRNGFAGLLEDIKNKFHFEKNFKAVVLGIPGEYDFKNDIMNAPNLPQLKGVSPKSIFAEIFSTENVFTENDVNLITLGENFKGVGKKWRNFILLAIGTGLGGGMVFNGKLVKGRDGGAGEIGHITVETDGLVCSCGRKGCLEAYASGYGIKNIYKNVLGGVEEIGAEEIFNMCISGDKQAVKVFEVLGRYLGMGIGNLINIFNPEGIVLTGSVSKSFDCFKKSMFNAERERVFLRNSRDTPIVVSKVKNHSFWGGISLLKERGVINPS